MRSSPVGLGDVPRTRPNDSAGADWGEQVVPCVGTNVPCSNFSRREGRGVCLRETLERERQPRRSSPHETSRSGIAYAAGMGLQGDGALPSGQRLGFGEL
jgi:hypothetical protein